MKKLNFVERSLSTLIAAGFALGLVLTWDAAAATAPVASKGPPACSAMATYPGGACGSRHGGLDGNIVATAHPKWPKEVAGGANPIAMQASAAHVGEDLFLIVAIGNVTAKAKQKGLVACDLWMTRPDGSVAVEELGQVCLDGLAPSGAGWIFLPSMGRRFSFDASDPRGVWKITMVARDLLGKSSVLMWTRVENMGPTK